MTPIEFGVSRSKVKVTVTFKFRGAYMFYKHFLLIVNLVKKGEKWKASTFRGTVSCIYMY